MPVTKNKVTIDDLIKMGFPIKRGKDYIPKKWLPKKPISLTEVHRRLAKIKGNLSDTITQIRREE